MNINSYKFFCYLLKTVLSVLDLLTFIAFNGSFTYNTTDFVIDYICDNFDDIYMALQNVYLWFLTH